ncbi:MAG TPA: hypothetical protein VEB42_09375, partial [Chitinophagaceae bacterium]|nr:hypothetical protein [Chitinophagaceae bacterium]
TVEQAEPVQSTNSTTTQPATTNEQQMNSPERQPQTLEQGNGIPEVTPNKNPDDEGINNGTTSDELLRERTDKPEE